MMPMRASRLRQLAIGLIVLTSSFAVGTEMGGAPSSDLYAQSDAFWSQIAVNGMSAEEFSSLEAMAKAADLVVVGRFTDLARGREWVANAAYVGDPLLGDYAMARFADAPIAVESILGEPRVPFEGTLVPFEIFLPLPNMTDDLRSALPQERTIFFFRNKGKADDPTRYRLTNDEQGILREIDGRVAVLDTGAGHFLERLNGQSFDAVVAELQTLLGH